MLARAIVLVALLAGCSIARPRSDGGSGDAASDARRADARAMHDAPAGDRDAPVPDAPPADVPLPDAGPCPLAVAVLHGNVAGVDLSSLEVIESHATTACPIATARVRLAVRGAPPGSLPEVALGYGGFAASAPVITTVTTATGSTDHAGMSSESTLEDRGGRYWLVFTYQVTGSDAGGRVEVPYCVSPFCL